MFSWLFRKKKKKPIRQKNDLNIITRDEVFKTLVDYWPKINPHNIKLADGMYVCPSRKEVEKILFESKVDEMIYRANIGDCDKFAVLLYTYVIRKRYEDFNAGLLPERALYSWAFGELWHRDPIQGPHAINLCITSDSGILFVEPQTDRIWKAERSAIVDFARI